MIILWVIEKNIYLMIRRSFALIVNSGAMNSVLVVQEKNTRNAVALGRRYIEVSHCYDIRCFHSLPPEKRQETWQRTRQLFQTVLRLSKVSAKQKIPTNCKFQGVKCLVARAERKSFEVAEKSRF